MFTTPNYISCLPSLLWYFGFDRVTKRSAKGIYTLLKPSRQFCRKALFGKSDRHITPLKPNIANMSAAAHRVCCKNRRQIGVDSNFQRVV